MRICKYVFGVIFLFLMISLPAQEIVLAENGKTDYCIVIEGKNAKNVWNAKFLAWFLKEKTGATYPIRTIPRKNFPSIYLGVSEPMKQIVGEFPFDKMKDQAHVVRSIGKNIILYGKGYDADFYAIMEFLDKKFGIHWYQRFYAPEIKKEATVKLQPFHYQFEWAFLKREHTSSRSSDYFRGETRFSMTNNAFKSTNTVFSLNDLAYSEMIQPEKTYLSDNYHTVGKYIPAKNNYKPFPFIKNRDYFTTNPEFFGMNAAGKRTTAYYCFSNPEFRKELIKNIDLHFESSGRSDCVVHISSPDGVDSCHCPDCSAMAKRDGTPGAAFFDFLFEISKHFSEFHKDAIIESCFYQKGQTAIPPVYKDGRKLPKNIQMHYCIVDSTTNHDINHPENAFTLENLKKALKMTENVTIFTYQISSRVPLRMFPHARTNIVIRNMRTFHQLGVTGLFRETGMGNGFGWENSSNFFELELYIRYRLMKDINLDTEKAIRDYMDNVYGPAAQLVKQYHDELQYAHTDGNKWGIYLGGYDDDFITINSYLTLARIAKWQKMFDQMEILVKQSSPRIKKNLHNLRRSLDCVTYARWKALAQMEPEYFKNLSLIKTRIGMKDIQPVWGKYISDNFSEWEIKLKYEKKAKPIPEMFRKIPQDRIVRKIPKNSARKAHTRIVPDSDAAFGYAATIDKPDFPFNFGCYSFDEKNHQCKIELKKQDIVPGKYHLYHLGEVKPTAADCRIWFSSRSWATSLNIAAFYDLAAVGAKHDAWVSLKFPENYSGADSDVVLCDQIILIKK